MLRGVDGRAEDELEVGRGLFQTSQQAGSADHNTYLHQVHDACPMLIPSPLRCFAITVASVVKARCMQGRHSQQTPRPNLSPAAALQGLLLWQGIAGVKQSR